MIIAEYNPAFDHVPVEGTFFVGTDPAKPGVVSSVFKVSVASIVSENWIRVWKKKKPSRRKMSKNGK